MDFKRRRLAVTLRNQLNYPLQFNPFVFSKIFLLWVSVGIIGGIIAGTYWIVLEGLLHFLAQFQHSTKCCSFDGKLSVRWPTFCQTHLCAALHSSAA